MRFDVVGALIVGAVIPIALCAILFKICRRKEDEKSSRFISILSRLDVPIEHFGGGFNTKLVLISCLCLFLEMLLIHWVSSELCLLGYYKNFVLIACFLGFGIGCYLSKRKIHLSCLAFPLLILAFTVGLPWQSVTSSRNLLIAIIGSASTIQFSAPYFISLAAAVLVFAVPLFSLVVFTFVPIGQMVGALLEQSRNGVKAYSINVLASLAGIFLYALLCIISQPPPIWFSAAALIAIVLVWKIKPWRWIFIALFALVIATVSYVPSSETKTYWSPYQKLKVTPNYESGELVSYSLTTNNSWYQQIINLSDSFVKNHPALVGKGGIEYNLYNIPYRFYSDPPSVLILGSGMGNDVAAALRHGAARVVAVEIDPVILKLGRQLHFEKPYDDVRVTAINDDARSYIQKSRDRFSLIIFSLLDAQITSSHYSNVRIDNYVYTVEALQAAKKLLAPEGVLIIKFQIDNTHWIAGRLQHLVSEVFERTPLQIQSEVGGYTTKGRFFIAGSPRRIAEALRDDSFREYVLTHSQGVIKEASLTTDDWPFFYQHEPGIPASVIILSLVLFGFTWLLLRKLGLSKGKVHYVLSETTALGSGAHRLVMALSCLLVFRGFQPHKTKPPPPAVVLDWHFFFLGAGFMLLEVQVVSKLALLFGTTWMVNSIVVGGIMVLIVGANLLVEKFREFPLKWAYSGIGVTMALAYIIPLRLLFIEPAWLKGLAVAGLLLSPVFFAGIVFIRSFAAIGFKGEALGANLLGALAGGLLESLSLWTGLRSLLIIALVMYLLSYLFLRAGFLSSCRLFNSGRGTIF